MLFVTIDLHVEKKPKHSTPTDKLWHVWVQIVGLVITYSER